MYKYLLNPKNWFIAIGYFIIQLLILLPYATLMHLGAIIGYLFYYMLRKRRQIVEINIRLCFPNFNEKQQAQLIKANFISTGKALFETALALWAPDKKLKPLCEISGIEYIDKALKFGHGILLISPHFVTMEMAGRLLAISYKKTPMNVLYRKHNNPFIEYLITTARKKYYGKTIGKKNMLTLIRCLQKNELVIYAPDQNINYQMVFTPFFGIKAATVTMASAITRKTGAKVVPMAWYRKPHNKGYLLQAHEDFENFPSGDNYKDTLRLTRFIEDAVKKHPEQYLWMHRRFRTRPHGEPLIYPRKRKY